MTVIEPETSTRTAVDVAADARRLRWATTFFALTVLFHNGDHARRGADSVSDDLFWVGLAGILVEVGLVVLVFMRHRWAPSAAASLGFGLAFAYVMVHALPERGWLSDPLLESGAETVSRVAAVLLILSALWVGATGTAVIRRRGGLAAAIVPDGPPESLAHTLTNPVVAAMVAGNAVVVTTSLVGYL